MVFLLVYKLILLWISWLISLGIGRIFHSETKNVFGCIKIELFKSSVLRFRTEIIDKGWFLCIEYKLKTVLVKTILVPNWTTTACLWLSSSQNIIKKLLFVLDTRFLTIITKKWVTRRTPKWLLLGSNNWIRICFWTTVTNVFKLPNP